MNKEVLNAIEDAVARAVGAQREERLLDARDLARRLGCSRGMAYKLMANNELPTVALGRSKRVPSSAVDHYIKQNTRAA